MIQYLADYIRGRNDELIYISLYRRMTEKSAPEEYQDGKWKITKDSWEAFCYDGSKSTLLNNPIALTEQEALALIDHWTQKK
jgi:hypothetical protein